MPSNVDVSDTPQDIGSLEVYRRDMYYLTLILPFPFDFDVSLNVFSYTLPLYYCFY